MDWFRRCAEQPYRSHPISQKGLPAALKGEYKQFAHIALGSLSELETQLILTERLGYGSHDQVNSLLTHLDDIRCLLCGLIRHLKTVTSDQ